MKSAALTETMPASGKRSSCREKRTPTESLGSSPGPSAALLSVPGQFAGGPHGLEVGDSIYPTRLLVCVETQR